MVDVDVEPGALQPSWLQRYPGLLRPTVFGLTAAIFVADRMQDHKAALSVLYTIPILVSLWIGKRHFTLGLSGACVVLALVSAIPVDRTNAEMATDAAAVFSIVVAASLGLMRLRSERELAYVRKLAITTLRSLGEAVIAINKAGELRFANPVACELLGRTQPELMGRRAADVFIARDLELQRAPLVELAERGLPEPREALLFALGGRRVPIEYVRTPIQSTEGEQFGEVVVFRDISTRKEHEEAIKRLAYRDDLTGLPNRVSLADRMQLELAHARRNKEQLAVAYVDLDGFKDVNDKYGHAAGDALLRTVSERIRGVLRGGDTVARLGGDEFVIVLPAIGGPDQARRVGEKVIEAIESPVEFEGKTLRASASLGVAMYPRDGHESETLMRRADKAMYRAKSLGRGNVYVYQSVTDSQIM